MKYNKFKFKEITKNYDKNRVPLSAIQRAKRQGSFRYYGAQGVIDYIDDYLFDGNYLLIAEDGENLKSQKKNIAQLVSGKFWVNNHAHIIQTNDLCELKYLYYFINSIDISKYITGSAQPKLSQSNLNTIEIELPNIKNQRQIVEILGSIDEKIKLNNEINNNLEQQAQIVFDNIFPNISNGTNHIGNFIIPKRGKSLLSKDAISGNVPVIAGGLEPSTYHNTANTKEPVLTISASGANAGYVSLWNVPIWSSDSSYIDSTMTNDVFFWYVLLKKRQKEIFDAQTGSAQPHIYPQHIAAMPINNVTKTDITAFTQFVTPLFKTIGQNKYENAHLSHLINILLPKLISGELDISNIDL